MRIFYASDKSPNAAFQSELWRSNLYQSLVDLGHEVVEFKYDLAETFRHLDTQDPKQKAFITENRPRVTAALLRQIEAAHAEKPVDLLFTYFYDACVLPEAIDAVKALGIVTVNWYCNGSYQLHLVSEISPHYDWCLVPEKFRLADYKAMGARPLYCQEAANPDIYHPFDLPKDYDIAFVGQAYGERPGYIHKLIAAGLTPHVWGPGWQRLAPPSPARRLRRWGGRLLGRAGPAPHSLPPHLLGGPLSDTELVQMYSRAKINLGFSACGETHRGKDRIVQVRLRDFEVPMSGGFYLVEYMEELKEFYEIGHEIACYDGPDDLIAKIKYYLAHEAEREAIARAGRARCLRDHTWQKRFQTAFAEMSLPS